MTSTASSNRTNCQGTHQEPGFQCSHNNSALFYVTSAISNLFFP